MLNNLAQCLSHFSIRISKHHKIKAFTGDAKWVLFSEKLNKMCLCLKQECDLSKPIERWYCFDRKLTYFDTFLEADEEQIKLINWVNHLGWITPNDSNSWSFRSSDSPAKKNFCLQIPPLLVMILKSTYIDGCNWELRIS